jgi:two-component system phosphate regulon sensor histidine kinase PhoR
VGLAIVLVESVKLSNLPTIWDKEAKTLMVVGLIIGLIIGMGLCLGQRNRLKSQIARLLIFSPDMADLVPSLSIVSLVNREILYVNKLRQKQEIALQTWQQILEKAPIGFLRIDGENQLLWCNEVARTLLHIDRWQPNQIRLLLELVRSYELDQLIETTRSRQTPQVQEWLYYPSTFPLEEGNTGEIEMNQGSIAIKGYGYPLSQGEISVFVENQQPLRKLSRSRDRAVSDLTHELRTPLTSISLLAETLEGRLNPPESRWSQQISQEVARLMTLVQEWLDLSQLYEDPYQYLNLESLSVQSLVDAAWHTLDPLAQEKNLTLNYHDPEQVIINGDRSRLIQVFLNLLDNGIKHSPIGAEIKVKVGNYDSDTIRIDFIDQGSGFAPKDLPYVFERLYRGEASRTRQQQPNEKSMRQGSGLGLAIVKQIIQAHKGSVSAKNHPETGGAWLQVILPYQDVNC